MYDIILCVSLALAFGYCLYLGFRVTKKLYGGRFTAVLPPLVAATALLFAIHISHLVSDFYPPMHEIRESTAFVLGLQMLQIGAGVLFASVLYKIYQIGYATSGFFRGD